MGLWSVGRISARHKHRSMPLRRVLRYVHNRGVYDEIDGAATFVVSESSLEDSMEKYVLVTGATGNVGSQLTIPGSERPIRLPGDLPASPHRGGRKPVTPHLHPPRNLLTMKRTMALGNPNKMSDYVSSLFRSESRRVLATLIRLLGDIDQAEEAMQEAFSVAVERWPREGIPDNPRSWLISTGRFKGIDAIRRRERGRELHNDAARNERNYAEPDEGDGESVEDDQLRLIFTCCHPLLPMEGRIALALREVCGMTTDEVARSFLVSRETMKRRLSRAKAFIRKNRIPYEIPTRTELAARLDAVLHVVYLIFNEGYVATAGTDHTRSALTREAIFLARELVRLIPAPEVLGLLALLIFHESRSAVRVDVHGDPVALEDQDRALWDRGAIDEAYLLLQKAMMSGTVGSYTLQAAIASVHAMAKSVDKTNWDLIVTYYDMLLQIRPSPVVDLQKAIAVGMRDGPDAGLELIDGLIERGPLSNYHPAYAARADFARRSGQGVAASEAYRRALELAQQEPEKRYLRRRLAEVV